MSEIFGDFIEAGETQEFLIISFSPEMLPLKERWRNNSISADFLADYWGTFFPIHSNSLSQSTQAEVRDTVSYIANELLENAIKFSYRPSEYPIRIALYLTHEALKFYVGNSVHPQTLKPFQDFIHELLTKDTSELYLRQLEKNAENENNSNSGIGFLTLLNDYGAKLAWKFEPIQANSQVVIVTTMVNLPISRSCRI